MIPLVKKTLLFTRMTLCLFAFGGFTFSQTDSIAKHSVYVNAAGPGGYWSVNYAYNFRLGKNLYLSPSIGFSTLHLKDYSQSFNPDLIFPVGAHLSYGKKHRAEFGMGEILSSFVRFDPESLSAKRFLEMHTYFLIGYRYHPPLGGMLVRVFYSPLLEFNQRYRHWGGISIGYSF